MPGEEVAHKKFGQVGRLLGQAADGAVVRVVKSFDGPIGSIGLIATWIAWLLCSTGFYWQGEELRQDCPAW